MKNTVAITAILASLSITAHAAQDNDPVTYARGQYILGVAAEGRDNARVANDRLSVVEPQLDRVSAAAEENYWATIKAQETADTASTEAKNAKIDAYNAQESANYASDKAYSADKHAGAAQADAKVAYDKAVVAHDRADQAYSSAENAGKRADKAQRSAEDAHDVAVSAHTAADTADSHATKARAKADGARARADYATGVAEKAVPTANAYTDSKLRPLQQSIDNSVEYTDARAAENYAYTDSRVNAGVKESARYADKKAAESNRYTEKKVNEAREQVDNEFKQAREEYRGGIAAASALAGIPQSVHAGAGSVGFGLGSFAGSSALAVGVSYRFSDDLTTVKLSAGSATGGYTVLSAGASYEF